MSTIILICGISMVIALSVYFSKRDVSPIEPPVSGGRVLVDESDGTANTVLFLILAVVIVGVMASLTYRAFTDPIMRTPETWIFLIIIWGVAARIAWPVGQRVREFLVAEPGHLSSPSWPLRAGETVTLTFTRRLRGNHRLVGVTAELVLIQIVPKINSRRLEPVMALPVPVTASWIEKDLLQATLECRPPYAPRPSNGNQQYWRLEIKTPLGENSALNAEFNLEVVDPEEVRPAR